MYNYTVPLLEHSAQNVAFLLEQPTPSVHVQYLWNLYLYVDPVNTYLSSSTTLGMPYNCI